MRNTSIVNPSSTHYTLLSPEKARARLAAQGNWPTRSASFPAEDAAYNYLAMAAHGLPQTYGAWDQPLLDYPALANYLGAPQESFDHLFYWPEIPSNNVNHQTEAAL